MHDHSNIKFTQFGLIFIKLVSSYINNDRTNSSLRRPQITKWPTYTNGFTGNKYEW